MSRLYDRRIEVSIDGFTVIQEREGRQFKITFDVLTDFGGFVSYAELVLANMTENTTSKFKRGSELTIRAGYKSNTDIIFKGIIRNFIPDRDGATKLHRIIARGNVEPSDRPTINKTLGKNATLTAILKELASALELPLIINPSDFASVKPYVNGFTASGDPERILKQLAKTHKFQWVIENGKLVVVPENASRLGLPKVISQFTGMEGKPEITEVGADVKTRLDPTAKVGDTFIIESNYKTFQFSNIYFQDIPESAGTGEYKAIKVRHVGDTWGDDWTTERSGIRKPA